MHLIHTVNLRVTTAVMYVDWSSFPQIGQFTVELTFTREDCYQTSRCIFVADKLQASLTRSVMSEVLAHESRRTIVSYYHLEMAPSFYRS